MMTSVKGGGSYMIDTKLRGIAQPLFDKVSGIFVKLKIQPDRITIAALIFGLMAGGFVVLDLRLLAFVFLWISGLLDVLDGSVARLCGKSSKRGAYMDLVFDRMVEASIILGFYFLLPENALVYLLFFITVLFNFTTFIVAGALFDNDGEKSMHYDVGIAERTETFIVFSLMMIFPSYLVIILGIFDVIIFITGVIRFNNILKIRS